ncbi:hypothetical protein KM043_002329 [Ampulex compressa]|nr:hypothetical protein KM043_002329 [Ampulex compressa]
MIQELEIIKPLGPKPRPPIHKMQDVQDSSSKERNNHVKNKKENKTANKEKMEEKRESNNNLDRLMESVQLKFENQISNAWNDILAGIHEVLDNPNRPSIIIFFANETNTMNCLAKEIGHVSGLVLGSGSYLTLNPKDFGTDPGELIDKLKIEIDKKKAVVIQDLLNINANALRALHNFCDRENPLVKKAVYIITMMVDGYQSPQKQMEL